MYLLIIGIVFGIFYIYYVKATDISTPINITTIIASASNSASSVYQPLEIRRKSLSTLLSSALPADERTHGRLINFYILTANMGGLFAPSVGGVYDSTALEYALRAGARGFIFDIYSGSIEQNYAPMLKVLEPGSNWKVQTLNEIPLGLALETLRKKGFDTGMSDNRHNDPMILYFRFRGKIITTTLNLAAAAIRATLEGYRVATSENAAISTQPIENFSRKVIIYSNYNGSNIKNTAFNDYCNSLADDKNMYDPKDVISAAIPDIVNKTKMTLAICAPTPENTMSDTNAWMINSDGTSPIDSKGINMVGLNFFSFVNTSDSLGLDSGLSAYIQNASNNKFGTYSFWMKPSNLRYIVTMANAPTRNNLAKTDGTPGLSS